MSKAQLPPLDLGEAPRTASDLKTRRPAKMSSAISALLERVLGIRIFFSLRVSCLIEQRRAEYPAPPPTESPPSRTISVWLFEPLMLEYGPA